MSPDSHIKSHTFCHGHKGSWVRWLVIAMGSTMVRSTTSYFATPPFLVRSR